MGDNLRTWSVEDVSKWLDSIGLGHKNDLVTAGEIDGKMLFAATEDDLISKGFAKLQAKKMIRSLEPIKEKMAAAAAPASSAGSSSAETEALKKEVADLRKLISSLSVKVDTNARATATATAAAAKQPPPHTFAGVPTKATYVNNFCGGARIEGNETQQLTVTMRPGDVVRAEPGAMVFCSSCIEMETKTGGNGWERLLTGQRIFLTEFFYTGPTGTAGKIAFTPDFPGQIIPISLEQYGGKVICQKSSLLCSSRTVDLTIEYTWEQGGGKLGAGMFGGEGFILQGLNGSGHAFLNARGVVTKMVLGHNELLVVSTGCLVAFSHGVRYTVQMMEGGRNVFFGGEGLFVSHLTGPGTVWVESHNLDRMFEIFHKKLNGRRGGG